MSPKYFERQHRDKTSQLPEDHSCTDFSPDMLIPPKWRSNILSCRTCKRSLVRFLSTYFLEKIKRRLGQDQRFVTAGGLNGNLKDQARSVTSSTQPTSDDSLLCNTEESDTRIWLHVVNSAGTRKLVLSPDTDVYHIGLPIIAGTNLECIVRLSSFNSIEHKFLDIQLLEYYQIRIPIHMDFLHLLDWSGVLTSENTKQYSYHHFPHQRHFFTLLIRYTMTARHTTVLGLT